MGLKNVCHCLAVYMFHVNFVIFVGKSTCEYTCVRVCLPWGWGRPVVKVDDFRLSPPYRLSLDLEPTNWPGCLASGTHGSVCLSLLELQAHATV